MATSLKRRQNDLVFLCCQHHTYRKQLLKHIDSELVKCICHGTAKVLDGTVPINTAQKKTLKKDQKLLRKLVRPNITTAAKKRLIVQSGGGFLLGLIPAVIGALASLIR